MTKSAAFALLAEQAWGLNFAVRSDPYEKAYTAYNGNLTTTKWQNETGANHTIPVYTPFPGNATAVGEELAAHASYANNFDYWACLTDGALEYGQQQGPKSDTYRKPNGVVKYADHMGAGTQLMTPEVCFEFCKQIENVNFFGIQNGANCYCSLYSYSAAGETGGCDVPCEGAQDKTCGGAAKSSIFHMNSCASLKAMDVAKEFTAGQPPRERDMLRALDELKQATEFLGNGSQFVNEVFNRKAIADAHDAYRRQYEGLPNITATDGEVRKVTDLVRRGPNTLLDKETVVAWRASVQTYKQQLAAHQHWIDAISPPPSAQNFTVNATMPEDLFEPVAKNATIDSACSGKVISVHANRTATACAGICKDTTGCEGFQTWSFGNSRRRPRRGVDRMVDTCTLFSGLETFAGFEPTERCARDRSGKCYIYKVHEANRQKLLDGPDAVKNQCMFEQ